jgi:holo-ACP synthase/triphosphoribosyl-dephospho-CoA synthase
MDLSKYLTDQTVELGQMLAARERRVDTQERLQRQYPMTLVCFSLNIAGAVKVFPLSIRAFQEGVELIHCQCRAWGIPIRYEQQAREHTGYEAFFCVDAPAPHVKKRMTELEEGSSLGRLFDIDVLSPDGSKCSRTQLGAPQRSCLICGGPAFVCSRSRKHSLEELLSCTCALMDDYFAQRYAARLSSTAARALLYEVLATPKPGLVDKHNSGAHQDMDIVTFETSALALLPFFASFVTYGIDHCHADPVTFLPNLRPIGIQAEIAMLRATGGVNTHKGIIFSLGLILAALGSFYGRNEKPNRQTLRRLTQSIAAPLREELNRKEGGDSNGARALAAHGVRGARGEALDGFPALFDVALPVMDALVDQGVSRNDVGVVTLLHIMAATQDTNLIARGSYVRMQQVQEQIRKLLTLSVSQLLTKAEELDRQFIQENLSPGGSADLLALAYFVCFMQDDGLIEG